MEIYVKDLGDHIEVFNGYAFKSINKIYLIGYDNDYLSRIENLLNEKLIFNDDYKKEVFIDNIKKFMENI